MKKASKEVRHLLRVLMEVNQLAGRAKAGYMDDRAENRWNVVVPPLEKIEQIVYTTLESYEHPGIEKR